MNNSSRLVHPDSSTLVKYCMGTGLQMRKGRTSHKLKSCEYHDLNKSKQGKFLKSMTQEAMQVKDRPTILLNYAVKRDKIAYKCIFHMYCFFIQLIS
jgi:hypothetical protein